MFGGIGKKPYIKLRLSILIWPHNAENSIFRYLKLKKMGRGKDGKDAPVGDRHRRSVSRSPFSTSRIRPSVTFHS